MDITNLFFTVITCMLYFARTFDMCLFDSDPIWRMPKTDEGPSGKDLTEAKEAFTGKVFNQADFEANF